MTTREIPIFDNPTNWLADYLYKQLGEKIPVGFEWRDPASDRLAKEISQFASLTNPFIVIRCDGGLPIDTFTRYFSYGISVHDSTVETADTLANKVAALFEACFYAEHSPIADAKLNSGPAPIKDKNYDDGTLFYLTGSVTVQARPLKTSF